MRDLIVKPAARGPVLGKPLTVHGGAAPYIDSVLVDAQMQKKVFADSRLQGAWMNKRCS